MNRGKLIKIDSPPFCGKTTLVENVLKSWDTEKHGKVKSYYDPGIEKGHPMNELRTLVKNCPMSTEAEIMLFQAGRLELWKMIQETIDKGINVIVDRTELSTWVYQARLGNREDFFSTISKMFTPLESDITIVLDAPFDVLEERMKNRLAEDNPNMDKFKLKSGFRKLVWNEYHNLESHNPNIIRLECGGNEQEVMEKF